MAGWLSDGDLDVPGLRNCGPGNAKARFGHTSCDHAGEVHFNLSGGELTSRKGSQDWCGTFVAETYSNTTYVYAWEGDCSTSGCSIEITNAAYYDHSVTADNGWPAEVGLLVIKGHAEIEGPTSSSNPYLDPLNLVVDRLEVGFQGVGTNSTLAGCRFLPAPGELVFVSMPVE